MRVACGICGCICIYRAQGVNTKKLPPPGADADAPVPTADSADSSSQLKSKRVQGPIPAGVKGRGARAKREGEGTARSELFSATETCYVLLGGQSPLPIFF
jgi:hypothetical protein